MQNSKNAAQQQQQVVAQQHTVANAQSLRARRVALVQTQRAVKYRAAKLQAHNVAQAAWVAQQQQLQQTQAFNLAVQQLAAQYGVAINPTSVAPRANSATVQPSSNVVLVNGVYLRPVAAVHAIAAQYNNRKQTIAACLAAGINPATAATQWGVYKKQHGL